MRTAWAYSYVNNYEIVTGSDPLASIVPMAGEGYYPRNIQIMADYGKSQITR